MIITDASDEGMVDIHDRRPIVFGPEAAREWLEADLSASRAEQLMHEAGRKVADFEWFAVSKAVGKVANHGPELIEPVEVEAGVEAPAEQKDLFE